MCDGMVIDAHLLPAIRRELVQESGPLFGLLSWLLGNCGIARTPLIEEHWRTKIKGTDVFFWSWYDSQIERKSIKDSVPKKLPAAAKKRLRADFGLTREPYLVGYLECAHGSSFPKYILGEDIHLYEPKAGSQSTAKQNQIRNTRSGALCKYLEQQLGIFVGTVEHCRLRFPLKTAQCVNKNVAFTKGCP